MNEISFNKHEAPLSKFFIRGCGEAHNIKLEDHPEAETLKVCHSQGGVFVFKVVDGSDELLLHRYGNCGDNMHDTVGVLQTYEWTDGDWSVSCI